MWRGPPGNPPPPPPPGNPPGGPPPGTLGAGCPGGGNPIAGQNEKLQPTHGCLGGSGTSGPAALAWAASFVVNICPILGSILPTWVVMASVVIVVLI